MAHISRFETRSLDVGVGCTLWCLVLAQVEAFFAKHHVPKRGQGIF